MEEAKGILAGHIDTIIDLAAQWGLKLMGGIVMLVFGLWIISHINKWIKKVLESGEVDATLAPFIKSLISILLKVLLVISVMGMVGIQMTSFIAVLGAAGLAVGMALSGTLQNFAGGVIILILRPFKVGDVIEAQGFLGTVKKISIFNTCVNTLDNKLIIIPNGPLSTGPLTNFSAEPLRRVEWTLGIAYGDDAGNFKKAIRDFIAEDERILKDEPPFIALSELAGSSVNFTVRVWVNSADYWGVFFDMNEKVYNRFGDYKLNIPFPQMDIHLHHEK